MKKIKREELFNLLKSNKDLIFSVVFLKKNGELRRMTCRLDVKKHLKGGTLGYDAFSKGLMTVFDTQKKDYRNINLETLMSVTMKGEKYYVSE